MLTQRGHHFPDHIFMIFLEKIVFFDFVSWGFYSQYGSDTSNVLVPNMHQADDDPINRQMSHLRAGNSLDMRPANERHR